MQLLYPVFALVALTAAVLFRLAYKRFSNVAAGRADPAYFSSYRDGVEPEDTHILARRVSAVYLLTAIARCAR